MKPKNKSSVTQILWEIFPFDQDMKTMFMDSLAEEWINKKRSKGMITSGSISDLAWGLRYDDVMKMLTTLWTIVHSSAFDLWTLGFCNTFEWTIYEPFVVSVYNFFKETWATTVAWEVFIETDDYYWVSDWILKINWQNILVDYKTWTAYKSLYWIENKILKKDWTPYAKTNDVKKVSLQTSMYKQWLISKYEIHWMKAIWFTEQWYFMFDLEDDLTIFEEWKQSKLNSKPIITNKIIIWK